MTKRPATSPKNRIDLAAALAADDASIEQGQEITFRELCRAYLATQYDGADMQLKKWIDTFGDRSAWDIQPDELARAGELMIQHGYAPSTVNRNLSQIGSVYKWAKSKRMTPRGFISPTINQHRYDEPIRHVEVTDSEIRKLIDAAALVRDRRFAVLVRLLVDSGARRGEVLERRWRDIDLDKRQIHVGKTKTGVPRVLFFSPETEIKLRRIWPEAERLPDRLLFESKRAPGAVTNYRKAWLKVAKAIGRPDLRMHDLRHHRAKQLLEAGVTIGVAAQALGHSSLILQRRYGHLETHTTRAAIERSWCST